ncbi:hypothetical protein K439DRAFT_769740 [Ramaria rubella]|nr:hypothetical protein K439DRAFT_769740 [Ramaria rubella]
MSGHLWLFSLGWYHSLSHLWRRLMQSNVDDYSLSHTHARAHPWTLIHVPAMYRRSMRNQRKLAVGLIAGSGQVRFTLSLCFL